MESAVEHAPSIAAADTHAWRDLWTPARARLWLLAGAVAAFLPAIGMPLRGWLDFSAFYAAGDKLLVRAQDSGDVRTDVSIDDVVMLVAGISKMPATGEGQIPRILDIALEGLRRQAQPGGSTAR